MELGQGQNQDLAPHRSLEVSFSYSQVWNHAASQKSVEVCESVSFSFDSRFSIIKNDIYFMSWYTFHVWWCLWKYNVKWSCFINAPFKISLEERGMRSEAKRDIIDTAIETSFPHFFQHTIIRWSGSVFFLFFHTTDQDCHNNVWLSSSLLESLNQQTNLDLLTSPIPVSCLICISSDLFGKQVMLPALNGTVCCFQTKVRA